MPRVCVVVPCYNHGEFLEETLDSLQSQTYTDFEIIVVNDGSTDESTVSILNNLKQSRTRVIHTDNRGVSAARNIGIAESYSEYILPLDSDDRIAPDYLELAAEVLDTRPEVAIVYCERVLFGEREGIDSLPEYDPRSLLVDNCIYPAALFRKTDWKAVGGYNEKMIYGWEDWDFWISLSSLNRQVVKIPEPLFFYRVRKTSRDHSLRFLQKLAMMSLIILRHKRLYLCNLNLLIKMAFDVLARKLIQQK